MIVGIWREAPRELLGPTKHMLTVGTGLCWEGGAHRARPLLWAVGHSWLTMEGSVVESRPEAEEGVDGVWCPNYRLPFVQPLLPACHPEEPWHLYWVRLPILSSIALLSQPCPSILVPEPPAFKACFSPRRFMFTPERQDSIVQRVSGKVLFLISS